MEKPPARADDGPPDGPPQWQGLGRMRFSKWQGLGNTYIVLHEEEIPFDLTPERVRLLCDRNLGIGSDGILVIGRRSGEDRFPLRIFNPDGSEAEMCGNGVRMVARKLHMEGLLSGEKVVLETAAGEIVPKLGDGYEVTVDMGVARFGGEKLTASTVRRSTPACRRRGARSRSRSSTSATRTASFARPGRSRSCPCTR